MDNFLSGIMIVRVLKPSIVDAVTRTFNLKESDLRNLIYFLLVISSIAYGEEVIRFKTMEFAPSADSAFSIEGKASLEVYQAFRNKYPNIIPEGNSMGLQFEGPAGEAPLLMSIAGNTAPDVISVNGRQSGSYVQREFLTPLDQFINPEITEEEAKEKGVFDPDIMYKEEWEARVQYV